MSNLDLLTPSETAEAARQGWGLHHVYDAGRWRVMVLGMPNAERASQLVIAQAKQNSPLALKALGLVMKSNGNKI